MTGTILQSELQSQYLQVLEQVLVLELQQEKQQRLLQDSRKQKARSAKL